MYSDEAEPQEALFENVNYCPELVLYFQKKYLTLLPLFSVCICPELYAKP